MKFIQVLRTVMTVYVVLGLGSLSMTAEKEKALPDKEKAQGTAHTVQAGVGYATGSGVGIQAEKQPGSFTIPKGSQATKLKYSFADPKSDYTSTKLRGSNIYSVTEKRYMHELDHDPNFALPPGEYKFVVGGSPGASGTLNFRTIARDGVTPPPDGGGNTKPPIRKPPPSDTPKTGTPRDPLHPGGEGKRKVTVHFTTTYTQGDISRTGSADMPASLTVDKQKVILDFGSWKPSADGKTTATMRWEGSIEKQGDSTSVNGTTSAKVTLRTDSHELHTQYQGLFSGKLEGTALRGTYKESGTGAGIDGKVFHVEQTGEWSIKDFVR